MLNYFKCYFQPTVVMIISDCSLIEKNCDMQVEWYDLNIKVKYLGANSGGSTEIIQRNRKAVSNQEDLMVRNRDLKLENSVAS